MKYLKNSLCLFTYLIFFPLFLNAQPPGYLGNRFYTSFNLSSSPTLKGPTQNNNGTEYFGSTHDRSWGIDYEFEGNLSYVIGRYSSIGINLGQYYTGMKMDAKTKSLGQEFINFADVQYDDHNLFYRLNVKSVGVYYRKFRQAKGSLAPLGSYFFMGLKRSFITGEVLDKKTFYMLESFGLGSSLGHDNLNINAETAYNSILFRWGKNQILFDRIILKVEFRLAYPISLKAHKAWSDSKYDDYFDYFYEENPNESIFETRSYERIVRHEMLRFNLGVGVLLF